jgi:hypothetical protein
MKMEEIILESKDLAKLAEFYGKQLQLPFLFTGNNELQIRVGNTKLVFKQASVGDPFYHFAINIPANRILEAKTWMESRAILLRIPPGKDVIADFVSWHARSFYFLDPVGNIVELIARFDLENKTDEAFSSAQFINISEIGLVLDPRHLESLSSTIREQCGLDYFSLQAPLPDFKVIGDNDGLFIIVPEGRNWYPTSTPAANFPVIARIHTSEDDIRYQLIIESSAIQASRY